jgi:hypothetical protein
MNELTAMPVEPQGVSDIHFGGHHLTINCKNPLGGKFTTIGLSSISHQASFHQQSEINFERFLNA